MNRESRRVDSKLNELAGLYVPFDDIGWDMEALRIL